MRALLVLALGAVTLGAACSSSCPPPAASGAASASEAELGDPDLLGRAETLARQVCDCPGALCADTQAADFVDLLRSRRDNLDTATRDRLLELSETVLGCRARLAYPSEPDDMDGAGAASGSKDAPSSDGG